MAKRIPKISFPDPLLGWGVLAMKNAEMLAAASQVIARRSGRPNTPAQLFEMGNEKMRASVEASHAMTRQWIQMAGQAGPVSLQQWAAFWNSGLSPYHRKAVSNAKRLR
ncbi:MAG: hypothetical protein ABI669_04470 [Usitatibacter sp.]